MTRGDIIWWTSGEGGSAQGQQAALCLETNPQWQELPRLWAGGSGASELEASEHHRNPRGLYCTWRGGYGAGVMRWRQHEEAPGCSFCVAQLFTPIEITTEWKGELGCRVSSLSPVLRDRPKPMFWYFLVFKGRGYFLHICYCTFCIHCSLMFSLWLVCRLKRAPSTPSGTCGPMWRTVTGKASTAHPADMKSHGACSSCCPPLVSFMWMKWHIAISSLTLGTKIIESFNEGLFHAISFYFQTRRWPGVVKLKLLGAIVPKNVTSGQCATVRAEVEVGRLQLSLQLWGPCGEGHAQ